MRQNVFYESNTVALKFTVKLFLLFETIHFVYVSIDPTITITDLGFAD